MWLMTKVKLPVQNKALFILKCFHMFPSIAKPQTVQKSCRVSVLEGVQNPRGHGSGQPALTDPALKRELELDDLQRCFPALTIL